MNTHRHEIGQDCTRERVRNTFTCYTMDVEAEINVDRPPNSSQLGGNETIVVHWGDTLDPKIQAPDPKPSSSSSLLLSSLELSETKVYEP